MKRNEEHNPRKERVHIDLETGKLISRESTENFNHKRAKVDKVGGVHRGQRLVKNRQKIEATENVMLGSIDFRNERAERQRNERRAKRNR